MEIVSIPLPAGQPLANAYVNRTDERLVQLFGGHPEDHQVWLRRAQYLQNAGEKRVHPKQLAAVLRAYNRQFNSHEEVEAHIQQIEEGAPVIVGGQQAGLWTGPLLVIHKIVTVLQAAREASVRLGRAVVPVFWIAGEDHDWDEVNHTYIPESDNQIRKIAIDRPSAVRTSVSRTPVSREAWLEALRTLAAVLEDSPYKKALLANLSAYAEKSSTLTASFAHLISELFGQYGLVMLDADDPSVRRLEQPFFSLLIGRNDELEQALLSGAAHVRALGYQEQADVVEGAANLFVFADDNQASGAGERTLLFKRDGKYVSRRGTISLSGEQLLARLEAAPELFSNNVLSRPLMQDYLLPVLGTVLGHGEIAYWALTSEAFGCFGMQMPVIVPRMSFTLVEPAVSKYMESFGLSFEDAAYRLDEYKQQWLQERDEWKIGRRFEEARKQFDALYHPLLQLAGEIEAGLAPIGETNKNKIAEQMIYLERKVQEAHARRFDAMLRRLDHIAALLWPNGKPQERVLNPLYLLNRYGPDWITALMTVPYQCSGGHRLVYI